MSLISVARQPTLELGRVGTVNDLCEALVRRPIAQKATRRRTNLDDIGRLDRHRLSRRHRIDAYHSIAVRTHLAHHQAPAANESEKAIGQIA